MSNITLTMKPPFEGLALINALVVSLIRARPALATCGAVAAGYLVGRLVLR